jgi:acetyl esterase
VVWWVARHGSAHGWDGAKLTIGGQGLGGGVAAAVTRLAFEQGGPAVALQVLHYPVLDLTVPAGAKPSPLVRPRLRPWRCTAFDTAYAPGPATRADRLVSPAGSDDTADLAGIAPAVVIAAEYDRLRDEARRYAERLQRAGALAEYVEVTSADHAYDSEDDDRARDTYKVIAGHVRRHGIR